MIAPFAAALALFPPTNDPAAPRVVLASLFKNGYAVIVREIPLKDGNAVLTDAPRAVLGTLWFLPPEGVLLRSVTATTVRERKPTPLATLDELLAANVGKQVRIALASEDQLLGKTQAGRILSGDGQLLVLRTERGTVAIPKNAVRSVVSPSADLKWSRETETVRRQIRIATVNGGNGRMLMLSLERGLMWVPSYVADISDPKRLRLLCKATLINDLADLHGAELRLVAGFPNVPFAPFDEPFSAGAGVEQTLAALLRAGAPDEARREGALLTQNMAAAPGGMPFDAAFPAPPQAAGEQIEDLFVHRLSGLKLDKGDRAVAYLFATEAEYEHLYTWDVADESLVRPASDAPSDQPGEVWNCLSFRNRSGQPWTTAPVTVTKDGQILGQDTLRYTGRDAEALVRITKALEVRARATEEELSRERGAVRNSAGSPVFDLITLKGTLIVRNAKSETIRLRIRRDLTGEVEAAEGDPRVTKSARGLRETNPSSRLEWNETLRAGESLERTYTYKVYVPSRG